MQTTWTNSQPTPRCVALAGAIAGDAMADAVELAELFDVDVDQLAGLLALVAADRLGGSRALSLLRPRRLRTRLTVAGRNAGFGGDRLAGQALPAQRFDPLDDRLWALADRADRGRELRSFRPARPSASKRSTHLRTVRGQTPAASATAFGVCPPST